jgi:nucleoid DNA-binding protein
MTFAKKNAIIGRNPETSTPEKTPAEIIEKFSSSS